MAQPLGPDPSGKREYVGERERERELADEMHHAQGEREPASEATAKPSFWRRLFGKR